jgi:hypothetical protein
MIRHVKGILRCFCAAGAIGAGIFLSVGAFFWDGLGPISYSFWHIFRSPAFWLFDTGCEITFFPVFFVASLAWGAVLHLGFLLSERLRAVAQSH